MHARHGGAIEARQAGVDLADIGLLTGSAKSLVQLGGFEPPIS
jgi:hypothetical protein